MSFHVVSVKKKTKEKIDEIAKKTGMRYYEIVELAINNLIQKDGISVVLSEETFKELKKIKDTFGFEDIDKAIRVVLRTVRVLFHPDLKFYQAIKNIDELERMLLGEIPEFESFEFSDTNENSDDQEYV